MYVTVDVMVRKFGESELVTLTDNERPYQDVINHDKLQAAMDAANTEIDCYIAGRYKLPLQTIPPFLTDLACNMARYHACLGNVATNGDIQMRYDSAIKVLEKISKGLIQLGGSPAGESEPIKTSSNNVILTVGRRDFGGRNW